MEFENIVTDEFLCYKDGFVNGKNDVLNLLIGGVMFSEFDDLYDWYGMGYEDGYNFYLEYYKKRGNIPLELIVGTKSWDVVNSIFVARVSEYNMQTGNRVPVFSLQMIPSRR